MGAGFDFVVVGAGTAGCVLAARLSENPRVSVCLVEAGPDYGPASDRRWPADLLDSRFISKSHDWDRLAGSTARRARVVGGSSTENACVATWGARSDYDEWAPLSFEVLRPSMQRAEHALRCRPIATSGLSPWHAALRSSFISNGMPDLKDFNDGDSPTGVGLLVLNASDGVRWNAAFAYLDPARGRSNLTVLGDSVVDRVSVSKGVARGVVTDTNRVIEGRRIVVSAGAYGSPAVLIRSGIGPASDVKKLGVVPVADLPVGHGLLDHSGVGLEWQPTRAAIEALGSNAGIERWPATQIAVRAASGRCEPNSWDLHIFPLLLTTENQSQVRTLANVYGLRPQSSGSVTLTSRDPAAAPVIEPCFLTDPTDAEVIIDGIECLREAVESGPAAAFIERELTPGNLETEEYVKTAIRSFFHPVGTCALGPVVGDRADVNGVPNLYVVDASIMPTIPRANTNLTTAALAEHFAVRLLDG